MSNLPTGRARETINGGGVMSKLKIGDHLWRYTGVSILEYEVYGVVDREVGRMYEVKCLNCNDHSTCELLLADTKKEGYRYVDMISDDNQKYWHRDSSGYNRYHRTKSQAIISRNEWTINFIKENIKKSKDSIASNERKILEMEAIIEGLKDEQNHL